MCIQHLLPGARFAAVTAVITTATTFAAVTKLHAAEQEQAEQQIVIENLSVTQLRAEIDKIQQEFYRVFNQLNEEEDLDVVCREFTPTGSNIPQTGCEPGFVTRRRGDNANDYRLGIDELLTNEALIRELQPEFERLTTKMNEISQSNSYFRELGQILQALRNRLTQIDK